MSDIVEDALGWRLTPNGREAEHAVLISKLDALTRRLAVVEAGLETQFELTAQTGGSPGVWRRRFLNRTIPSSMPEAETGQLSTGEAAAQFPLLPLPKE